MVEPWADSAIYGGTSEVATFQKARIVPVTLDDDRASEDDAVAALLAAQPPVVVSFPG